MDFRHKEIGGFFEFGLSPLNQFPYPNATQYNSARSAFYDVLKNTFIEKLWMPKFICDSMIKPVTILGIEICYYDLDQDFSPILPEVLMPNEYLLYVNYFGLCTSIQKNILKKYSGKQVIFDHSQAFFVQPLDCYATIYSPRKFLPVAEGGLLFINQDIVYEYYERTAEEMVKQYQHTLLRSASTATHAYNNFLDNEKTFEDCLPRKISKITEQMLESFDYADFKEKRLKNFKFLHSQLSKYNQLKVNVEDIESPLTYPLMLEKNISNVLIQSKIYTPIYWLDSLKRVSENSFENSFISKVTHLICDQRYGEKEMQLQIDNVREYLK
ncbi:hypothetical protein [Acinetobacter pittii]|uniref:hypothetical protein n=1 Tax=Acinetobacter pittii TaxID=48296 RepID=UPI0005C61686|nr:hypothetical protein [Acinetobacter pittii]